MSRSVAVTLKAVLADWVPFSKREAVARCIYESIFVGDWDEARGAERECYMQAAAAVIRLVRLLDANRSAEEERP